MFTRRLGREVILVCAYTLAIIACVTIGKRLTLLEIFLLVGLLTNLFLFGLILLGLEQRNRRHLLRARPSLTPEELYSQCYAGSDIPFTAFQQAWGRIAHVLGPDAGRCRPEDTLSSLFPLPSWIAPWQWGDPGRLLELAAPHGGDTSQLATIDDIVRALAGSPPREQSDDQLMAA